MMDFEQLLLLIGFTVSGILYAEWRMRRLLKSLPTRIIGMLWVPQENVDEKGVKTVKAVLNPLLVNIMDSLMPFFLNMVAKHASKWIKANKEAGGTDFAALGQMPLESLLGFVPKKYQGIAAFLLPIVQPFLQGMFQNRAKKTGTTGTTENPFLKELNQ